MNKRSGRQLAEGGIPEIAGAMLERVWAVSGAETGRVLSIYLLLQDLWFRVFLDAGVLFLDVCDGPDAEDDLAAGEAYLDFSGMQRMQGEVIRKASVENGVFRIAFESGATLILEAVGEEAALRFVK